MRDRVMMLDSSLDRVLVLAMLVPFITFGRLNPAVVTVWGLLAAGMLCVMAVKTSKESSVVSASASTALACAAVFFVVRGLFASSPSISVVGTISQHNGAALWVLGLAWFVAGQRLASPKHLKRAIVVVSTAGFAYALAAVVEVLTKGVQRDWGQAAGVFENSSSLGQFMALAVGASVAWAVLSPTAIQRVLAAGAGITCVLVTLLAQSRAGLLGIGGGIVVAILLQLLGRWRWAPWVFGGGTAAAGLVTSALLVAASESKAGSMGYRLVSALGNDRDAIWRSAYAAFLRSPVVGRGLEQFSACVNWSYWNGRLQYNGTYDPHNLILAVLVGGGFVGAILASVAAAFLLASLARAHGASGSLAVAALAGGLVAVPATALVTWFTPAAVVASACLAGILAGVADTRASASVPQETSASKKQRLDTAGLWVAGLSGALALVICAWSAFGLLAEIKGEQLRRGGQATAQELEQLSQQWPEPAYASLALDAYVAQASATKDPAAVADADRLIAEWDAARKWHFNLAISSLVFQQGAANLTGTDRWDAFKLGVSDGRQADPASGLWDFLGAMEAERLNHTAEARSYAKEALKFPLSKYERSTMELIAK